LSKDLDAGLDLLAEMLRYPRFDEQRFRLAIERQLQNIKRRNDATASIAASEWGFLMNGEHHFSNRYPSSKTLQAIGREDLSAFHRKYIHPGNMILAVAGDFDRSEVLKKLEKAFGDWPAGETGPTSFAKPDHQPAAGVFLVHKEGVNQGRVSIGHLGITRGSPDEFPLIVANGILGASGFRSRIVARVRSDEGLAYNSGSRFEQGIYYPGDFQCWFQSKSNSCAYATKLVIEEIHRLVKEKVSQADLDDAVNTYVDQFPQRFPTRMALLETYVSDEYTGRDPKYWEAYIDQLRKVTPDDVHRVAQKYMHPDKLVILAVGDTEAMAAAGYDKAPEVKFENLGKTTRLPLRDSDTMKRP
jgi:predicted Zn-dependent peptidase